MIIEDVRQNSEQWLAVRRGRATASEFDKILTPTGKLSGQRKKYMRKLARECVTGDPLEWQGNRYTEWGTEMEDEAREVFAKRTGFDVHQVGFVVRSDGAPLGCSPDGLIKDRDTGAWLAGLEMKCPQVDTHVGYLMEKELPPAYRLQVHGSMALTGLSQWFFFSYHPGLNPFLIQVYRNDFTEVVSDALDAFLVEYAKERELVLSEIVPLSEEPQHGSESEEMDMII